ncbi:hypothetical protein CEXT_573571 [Caerostris extrusa]|uniref:Uncharacterized protein n=1 Tax=Caerostris extrusa TaxID=172846 RepID=A0AAV4SCR1_CAEEX|nr:hypothetical protein CEXT_573571 [Caerostris extrusa]
MSALCLLVRGFPFAVIKCERRRPERRYFITLGPSRRGILSGIWRRFCVMDRRNGEAWQQSRKDINLYNIKDYATCFLQPVYVDDKSMELHIGWTLRMTHT